MNFIFLQLVGPQQSWGSGSNTGYRHTEKFPTKSGVVGMILAGMGVDRDDDELFDSSGLKDISMSVRVDSPGKVKEDFQTILNQNTGENKLKYANFLEDPKFLVAISHDDVSVIDHIEDALKSPHWGMTLGRKSYVPSRPIYHSRGEYSSWAEAFETIDPIDGNKGEIRKLTCFVEDPRGRIELMDDPVSYAYGNRKYGLRFLSQKTITFSPVNTELNPMEMIKL